MMRHKTPRSDPSQKSFNDWAIVELFGHAQEVGFVTSETYGVTVLFRVDTPGLPDREYTLERPEYDAEGKLLPIGSKVRRAAVPARSRLIGSGAIYSIMPCTEAAAREAIEHLIRRPLILLELPAGRKELTLPLGEGVAEDDEIAEDDEL